MFDRITIFNRYLLQEKPTKHGRCLKNDKLKNVLPVLSRCHPGTLRDAGVRLLQLQLGEGAHQPQRHRTLLWREGQATALLRHVEERVGDRGGRQARLLAGRRQLLRQVNTNIQEITAGRKIVRLSRSEIHCFLLFLNIF